jgi:hypothetical protein
MPQEWAALEISARLPKVELWGCFTSQTPCFFEGITVPQKNATTTLFFFPKKKKNLLI